MLNKPTNNPAIIGVVGVTPEKLEVFWEKECKCCKNDLGVTKKPYSLSDLRGNAVSIEDNKVQVICNECEIIYRWTNNL